jgi:hypothetical protein
MHRRQLLNTEKVSVGVDDRGIRMITDDLCGGQATILWLDEDEAIKVSQALQEAVLVVSWALGQKHPTLGKVIGMMNKDGEPYRMLLDESGTISLYPLDALNAPPGK